MKYTRSSFHSNVTHEEEESSPKNENESNLKRDTPILYSTNRGLHLRTGPTTTTHTPSVTSTNATSTITSVKVHPSYSMIFCDLERWSTNRANTISLEDTFTIPKPAVVSDSVASNSLRFLPHKSKSVYLNGYSRFEVE